MNHEKEINKRRTFGIISHPDAGKTTLTEKLLLFGGAIQSAGAVKNNKIKKSATSDFMEIEKQRGISVATSVMAFNYRDKQINILDTPGHTMSHLCLLVRGSEDALFCGDTLFNAGVGNCHNGGNPLSLYNTFYNQLIKLDKKTKIYPGHDYLTNNLEFTLSLEPENKNAYDLLQKSKMEGFSTKFVSSFEIELKVNTFFRLKENSIKESLKNENLLSKNDSPQEIFLALRELRNKW